MSEGEGLERPGEARVWILYQEEEQGLEFLPGDRGPGARAR